MNKDEKVDKFIDLLKKKISEATRPFDKPYYQGLRAFRDGAKRDTNPWAEGLFPDEFDEWERGWNYADFEKNGILIKEEDDE